MRELNDQLIAIKSQMKEKERLENLQKRAKDQVQKLKSRQKELYQQLQKENLDVEKLEGMSIANIFNAIIGRKEGQLAREKQEALAAKLKYDSVSEELAGVEKEVTAMRRQLAEYWGLEEKYDKLIKEKEQLLMTTSADMLHLLDKLAEDKVATIQQRKELGEAITAGNTLLLSLRRVRDSLKSAGSWGTLDMLGGGLISTMAKHSNIDEARQNISKSQFLLNKFHQELQDVGAVIGVADLEIGNFLTFADYFFDGLFADLAVQSRINDARDKVESTIRQVELLIADLSSRVSRTEQIEERIERQRIEVIEKA